MKAAPSSCHCRPAAARIPPPCGDAHGGGDAPSDHVLAGKGGPELERCRFEITWNGRGDEGGLGGAAWDRGDGGLGGQFTCTGSFGHLRDMVLFGNS